ncbi:MAG: TetR/AcrR family transcriptional regulator C-terminal domain-containing protein, partial [Actinomycetota bacterium]
DVTDTQRSALSRDRIVERAIAIADAEGIEAVSMRRIASDLGATPMALYNHVANKDELMNGIAGQLLKEIDVSQLDPADWAKSIKTGYTEFRRVLLCHPNLLPVLQRKTEMSPDALRPIELAMSILQSAGFSPGEALQAHWTLSGFAMGHVLWQLTNPLLDNEDGESTLQALAMSHRRTLRDDEFPCLIAALPAMESYDMDAAWAWGIDAIIDGLKVKLSERR